MKIDGIEARRIFDSRGIPTIEVTAKLENGVTGVASAPSGASTGEHEAHEKRDGGKAYMGKDVSSAILLANTEIDKALSGVCVLDQQGIDKRLIELDGTINKSRLGANAMIATSLACAYAAANYLHLPLYRYLGGFACANMPTPMMNVINGGAHADNNIDIQEFMIVPQGYKGFGEAMRMCVETYHALKGLLKKRGMSTAVGDEGGFAPSLDSDEEALMLLMQAMEISGACMSIALDIAASEWKDGDAYRLKKRGVRKTGAELMQMYIRYAEKYPIISIEDPFGEDDFASFSDITAEMGERVMIVGDDLFTTNPERLERGIARSAANAILIKPNQIGTLTETLETVRIARRAGYKVIISHRSGETECTAIADIAVATGAEFIKSGAPARTERVSKYNRLLKIWQEA